jgi:hypothetical protein
MPIRPSAPRSIVLVTTVVATFTGPALAQDDAADIAAARKLGGEGVTLADAGNCQDALDKLARSEKMHHAVSVLERLGECQIRVGKLVEGAETLRRVLREQLPLDAPHAFVAAQERAQGALAEAKPKIARVRVSVAAPADATIWVTIDGVNEPTANLNADRFVDPGDHVIEAGAPGFRKTETRVHVGEGAGESVTLTLQPDPDAPGTGRADSPASTAPPSQADHTLAFIVGGVGLVGLGFGTAFGLGAVNAKSNLDGACANKTCPPGQQGNIDTGERLGTISTVGFVVGGIGLAAGAVLYFGNFGGSSRGEAGVHAAAYVTPGGVGLSGAF